MKNKIKLLTVLFTLSITLIACNSNHNEEETDQKNKNSNNNIAQEEENEENNEEFEEDDRDLEDIVDHFEDEGLNVRNTEGRMLQSDASDSIEIYIDDGSVQISKYPTNSKDLKEIKENGYIDGGEGFPDTNAKHNSLFSMVGYDEPRPGEEGFSDEEQEEIIDIFEGF